MSETPLTPDPDLPHKPERLGLRLEASHADFHEALQTLGAAGVPLAAHSLADLLRGMGSTEDGIDAMLAPLLRIFGQSEEESPDA